MGKFTPKAILRRVKRIGAVRIIAGFLCLIMVLSLVLAGFQI